jgi:Flp pilus assembly pilin Flp
MAATNPTNPRPSVLRAFWRDERGASMAEYAMLLAIVSALLAATIQVFGTQITAVFEATAGAWASVK